MPTPTPTVKPQSPTPSPFSTPTLNLRKFPLFSAPVDEQTQEIGQLLRQAREKAGLTIEDVQHRTRIPRSIIDALEKEDFTVFSSPTYAKSFLAQYSDFLSVNAEPWLDALEPSDFSRGTSALSSLIDTALTEKNRPHLLTKNAAPSASSSSGILSWLLWMIFSGILIYTGIHFYQQIEGRFASDPQTTQTPPPATPPTTPPPSPTPTTQPPPAPQPEEPTSPPRAIIVRD